MSEVSSSIAETNRMRAEMGLPPLAISSSEDRAAQAAAARAADEAAVERARVESIRAELARRKEARIVNARVAGQSLGESLVSATAGSARDWIERSRKLGDSEAAKAAALVASRAAAEKAAINDDAYTASALTGVKVAHSASDFASGSSVILTLKDSRLLAGGAGDALNDEEDELLNADLLESEKLRENNARKAGKSSKHAARFDGAHDDEESELLAKYSDAKVKEGIRLGAAGTLTAEEQDFQSNRALYEQDDARRKLNQLVYSLDDGANGAAAAEKERVYQTDFKEVKFKKKKGNKANAATTGVAAMDESADSASASADAAASGSAVIKKRANRKVKAPTESLLDFLPEPSAEDRAADLSSRSGGPASSAKQRREAEEQRLAKEEKDARYLRAIQAAEHKTAQRVALDKLQAQEFAAAAASAPAASSGSFVPPPPSSAPPAAAFKSAAAAAPAFGSAGFVPPPPPPMPAAAAAAAAMPAMAPPPGLWEEEEDLELAATLARARRIAAQQRKKHEGGDDDDTEEKNGAESKAKSQPTDSVRALADRVKEKRREDLIRVKQEPVEDDSAAAADSSSAAAAASSSSAAAAAAPAARSAPPGMRVKTEAGSGIVFTTTTEFVRGLQFDREEREEEAAAAAAKAHIKKEPAAASGAQAMDTDDGNGEEKKVSVQDVTDESETMKEERDGDRGASSSDSDSDDDNGGLRGVDEPYARTGVAAALALYKARGILKEGGNGRGRSAEEIAGDKFNLGKYDAFGREQSKKEQFRALSHRFHGIEPGLNKQEKRLQKVQEEAQRIQALRESGGVISKVAERTKATGAAHVVLDKSSTLLKATGAGEDGDSAEAGQKRKKHAGPFAQFGFGKGSFKKRKAAQEADAKKKAAAAGAGAAADTMQ